MGRRALRSVLGACLAALYAIAFGAAYYAYATGGWIAGAWLFLVALPYTATMVAVTGSVDFSGDSLRSVVLAATACCAAAYVAGTIVEAILRLMINVVRRRA